MTSGIFEAATGSSIHNPITPQGAVLFTTAYDHSTSDAGNPSLNCFQRHDLLFRRTKPKKFSHGGKMNSIKLKTFSTCHSVQKVVGGKQEDVYKSIQFVGVSINPVDANKCSDTYASALVSGLFTLVNTGEHTIEAGDIVVWTDTNVRNLKNNVRMPMSVAPLRALKAPTVHQILQDENTAAHKQFNQMVSNTCEENALTELVHKIVHDMANLASERVIGQAVSNASPGKAFDIIIGTQRR